MKMRYAKSVQGIVSLLEEHKAEDVRIFIVKGKTPFCDYVVLATASNSRALMALADYVVEKAEAELGARIRVEGKAESGWLAIDAKEVVVHLFVSEKREEFKLDELLETK